ncbi:virion-associated protein [Lamium leaf distortion virus]|uniref:Virion-associated protein n=1 Tax=Lamium leaf distortion virus TaxID=515320 RepID=B2CXY3_9VIRU|nr:virion-associated protein [Lamium leaf distortion virus]ACB69765.1 virion-associated protein [Lamium leaf distortion virus]
MTTTNLKEIHDLIIQVLEEIKSLKKDINDYSKDSNNEAIAAKIITDIAEQIKKCPCNKEILDVLKNSKDKQVIPHQGKPDTSSDKPSSLQKYSYPNFRVGNEELGESKNPDSLRWPEGFQKK